MHSILLSLLLFAQEPEIITVVGPPISHELKYCGSITSKKYTYAIMTDGKKIEIPIVNGYLPEVRIYKSNGIVIRRVFNYNREIPYKGGIPSYVLSTKPFVEDCESSTDSVKLPEPVKSYPKPMKVPFPEPIKEPTKTVEPEKAPAPKLEMKRPSEVDGGGSIIKPTY